MKVLIKRLLRFLKAECPNCQKGRLYNVDIYGLNTNIYECDLCETKYI